MLGTAEHACFASNDAIIERTVAKACISLFDGPLVIIAGALER